MLAAIEAQPGTYALVLSARAGGRVRIARLGGLRVQHGFYVYVGSALGPGRTTEPSRASISFLPTAASNPFAETKVGGRSK